MIRFAKTALRGVRAAIVLGAYSATAYRLWEKYGDAARRRFGGPDLPASPYPSAGAAASPPPKDPPGPVDARLIDLRPPSEAGTTTDSSRN